MQNNNKYSQDLPKPALCSYECWHLGSFGFRGSCDAADSWGSIQEEIEPGEYCLHPDKKDISGPTFIISPRGFCAVLEGTIIQGGIDDNTKLVKVLTDK